MVSCLLFQWMLFLIKSAIHKHSVASLDWIWNIISRYYPNICCKLRTCLILNSTTFLVSAHYILFIMVLCPLFHQDMTKNLNESLIILYNIFSKFTFIFWIFNEITFSCKPNERMSSSSSKGREDDGLYFNSWNFIPNSDLQYN